MAERNSAIDALRRGRGSTEKLKALLQNVPQQPETAFLLENISESFNEALACLNISASSRCGVSKNSDDGVIVNNSKKRGFQPTRKIGYRRRINPDSCKKVQNRSMTDGFTWRKYGQKEIFSSKFPRSYFRCTHKYDQKCPAIRQVQRSEENPEMYEIIYIGQHTCNQANYKINTQLDSSCIIDFGTCGSDQQVPPFSSSPLSSVKNENEDEVVGDLNSSSVTSFEMMDGFTRGIMGSSNDFDISSTFPGFSNGSEDLNGDSFDIVNMFLFDHDRYEPPY